MSRMGKAKFKALMVNHKQINGISGEALFAATSVKVI